MGGALKKCMPMRPQGMPTPRVEATRPAREAPQPDKDMATMIREVGLSYTFFEVWNYLLYKDACLYLFLKF